MTSNNPVFKEIQDWLFCLSVRKKSVCFCWIPSHVGIPGNERVDSLARSAVSLEGRFPKAVPFSDYFPPFRTYLYNRWQSFWCELSRNKLRTVKPNISPWLHPEHKNRHWETVLARLRIGHTRLTHSYLMTRSSPTLCSTCQSPLSVSHILLTCPKYISARTTAFPHLTSLLRPPNLKDILKESQHFHPDNIISFLKHTNLHSI